MPTLPSSGAERIVTLDALRGFAVIGIAWMNVYVFALPLQAYYNPVVYGGEGAMDRLVWIVSFVFIEDKFRTLFAMLFGAGCLMLHERHSAHEDAGRWRPHFARMAVLFVIGLAHAVLFASNDVLRAYALAGMALPLVAGLSSGALYAIAVGCVAVHVGAGMVVFGSGVIDFYASRMSSDAVLFANRNFGDDPAALQYALDLGREDLGARIARRSANLSGQLSAVASSLPINFAAMALGMGLWRDRMLAGEWRTFRLQRLAAICAGVALPGLLALSWWVSDAGFPGALMGPVSLVLSAPFDMLLGLAYAFVLMAVLSSSGLVTRTLAAAGRLSLTNYVMTSVLFAFLFASWGLGLFGQFSRAQAFAISFVPIAAMLAWSPLWLKVFGQGPLERVWRGASRALS
ncbi:MAG: DUF418 domain-containing protein [Pseudomonadota bacterium]